LSCQLFIYAAKDLGPIKKINFFNISSNNKAPKKTWQKFRNLAHSIRGRTKNMTWQKFSNSKPMLKIA